MKLYHYSFLRLLLVVLLFSGVRVAAQETKKVVPKLTIDSAIKDEAGNPITDATITSSDQRYSFKTGKDGRFSLNTNATDVLVIKAEGYATRFIDLSNEGGNLKAVVLSGIPAFTGEDNQLHTIFGSTDRRRTTGAYSIVKGKELENNPTMSIENSLGGRLNGLFQLQNTNSPGFESHNMFVRGGWGSYITIVDGVERDLTYLEPEVIESVQLLKDATLKSLYGGLQANGILVVKTKRGKAHENGVRINVQKGIEMPTRLPKFLNSYDYARYYNQALANDGLAPLYNQNALDAYKNGSSPILYPNVDYYNEFLNQFMNITKVSAQMTGGNENIRYFSHLGYQNNGGLEKYSQYPNSDNILTVRSSVDIKLNDFMALSAGFNGAMETQEWPNVTQASFMSALATNRPNDFPILIPATMVGVKDREFVFGGASGRTDNPYGLATERGYAERKNYYIQSDFSLNFNLDKWVKGLSVNPSVSFDIYNYTNVTKAATFAVYDPYAAVSAKTGKDTIQFTTIGQNTKSTAQSRGEAYVERNYALNFSANYNRTFGNHDLNVLLNYSQYQKEMRNVDENPRRQNVGLHLSYMNNKKYVAEFNLNRVGVNSFSPQNRYGYFPAAGLGWIASDEDFLSELSFLNYFKIKTSYGILGSTLINGDGGFSTRLYEDIWTSKGTIALAGEKYLVSMDRKGNPDLGFQKSYEFNIGFEAQMFNKSTWLSMGYFNNVASDLISLLPNFSPGVVGLNESLSYQNFNKVGLKGIEGEVSFTKEVKDITFNLGFNATYGITNRIKYSSIDWPGSFSGNVLEGLPADAILGLHAIGTFANQNDIDNSPNQFGVVRPGDIKYADTNNDNMVDNSDRTNIGNSSPRLQYGISAGIKFKGFNLDILGVGYGLYDRLISNTYYQIKGDTKYSQVVFNGLPNGNPHPQLSVLNGENNFVSSDYWISNGSFFKLRNIELGYTLPMKLTKKMGVNNVKIFTRGFNLLTISGIKDMDPENISAGLSAFPLCSTFTCGVSLSF